MLYVTLIINIKLLLLIIVVIALNTSLLLLSTYNKLKLTSLLYKVISLRICAIALVEPRLL